jgi:hypothetical protein
VTATPEYYERVAGALLDTESLTVLTVAGKSREQVAAAIDVDLGQSLHSEDLVEAGDIDRTAWAIVEVPGGALAIETTGYGDPTRGALRALSEGGGAAAVVRHNIQAHLRFGCARDGDLLFDDDEYMYIEDPNVVPAVLRPLFDLAWDDLDDEVAGEGPDGFAIGLAMAELVTGVEVTADGAARVSQAETFAAPSLVYAGSLDE